MYILALDVDGTAVDDRGRLGARSRQALTEARARGWLTCFVTGRRDVDMMPLWHEAEVVDYLLLNNGGKLVRTADRAVLFNELVAESDTRRLAEQCLARDWILYAVSGMEWWVNRIDAEGRGYIDTLGVEPTLYTRSEQIPCERIEGFMVTGDGEAVAAYIAAQGMDLVVVPSEPRCIDVMPPGVTKWSGLQRLADRVGALPAHIIAAGNYDNDLDMIRGAGLGVAVRNAVDHVKAAAGYVTRADNNNDAVAEIVEHWVLSGRFERGGA